MAMAVCQATSKVLIWIHAICQAITFGLAMVTTMGQLSSRFHLLWPDKGVMYAERQRPTSLASIHASTVLCGSKELQIAFHVSVADQHLFNLTQGCLKPLLQSLIGIERTENIAVGRFRVHLSSVFLLQQHALQPSALTWPSPNQATDFKTQSHRFIRNENLQVCKGLRNLEGLRGLARVEKGLSRHGSTSDI